MLTHQSLGVSQRDSNDVDTGTAEGPWGSNHADTGFAGGQPGSNHVDTELAGGQRHPIMLTRKLLAIG